MSRIEFIQPDMETWLKQFRFFMEIKVRFSETDALGHLNNVSYFTYFEQGRLEYLEHLGLLDQLMDKKGSLMIVTADLQCHYLGQVFFNERLRIGIRVAKIGRSSFDVEYVVIVKETEIVAAVGRGAVVLVDRKSGKSTPLPAGIKQIIVEYEGLTV